MAVGSYLKDLMCVTPEDSDTHGLFGTFGGDLKGLSFCKN